jgi:hypothetical protein
MTHWDTKAPTEADEQEHVVQYFDLRGVLIYATPNGGSRNKAEAKNLQRQGVKAGVPDLTVPIARGGYHGLYVEMKRDKRYRSTVSDKQEQWIRDLNKQGYLAVVCYGAREAIRVIDSYLKGGLLREADTTGKVQRKGPAEPGQSIKSNTKGIIP